MSGEVMRPEKGGNPRAAQTRIKGRNASAAGGQRAHDMRMGPQPAYVDQSRSHLNRVLLEPQTGAQLRAISEKRRALRDTARGMKSNASVAIVGIITFGHEAQTIFEELTPDQQDAAYLETAEAIATRLNSPLTGLVVHADESAPHAHFQLPAYDLTGHPISETAKRGVLREIQTLTGEIMGRHAPGIERGNSKASRLQAGASPADVVNRQVNQLHAELPAEIAAKEAERDAVQADLEKHQRHLTKAKTDLEKAIAQTGEESAKVEKIRKRAATYEKRVGAAQAELERLTSEQAAQQAALDKITRGKEKAQDELSQIEGQQVEARADLAAVETRKAETTVELDGLNSAVAQKKTNIESLLTRKAALEASLQSLSAP